MNEKICLAPGASSGIDKMTAKALAAGGAAAPWSVATETRAKPLATR